MVDSISYWADRMWLSTGLDSSNFSWEASPEAINSVKEWIARAVEAWKQTASRQSSQTKLAHYLQWLLQDSGAQWIWSWVSLFTFDSHWTYIEEFAMCTFPLYTHLADECWLAWLYPVYHWINTQELYVDYIASVKKVIEKNLWNDLEWLLQPSTVKLVHKLVHSADKLSEMICEHQWRIDKK
jgi:hypothetical protein